MHEHPHDQNDPLQHTPNSWVESHRFVPTQFVQPTLRFLRTESAGGIIMLLAAVAAVIVANSSLNGWYESFFLTTIGIEFGSWGIFTHINHLNLQLWINDGLMVGFFFVVGLEIKRELVVGELRDPRSAALPAIAAVGGMIVPAGLYLLFNGFIFTEGTAPIGWGIPMATDIAFAVGIVAMLGKKVPVSAKLFLLALAIVDDLGAILVIAVVYTSSVAMGWLVFAAAGLVVIFVMNRLDVRSMTAYLVVGFLVWLGFLESGVHATLAGVIIALMTPVKPFYDPKSFAETARPLVAKVDEYLPDDHDLHEANHHTLERVASLISDLQRLSRESLAPLTRLELRLAPMSSFIIVPLFAFANAGVVISGDAIAGAGSDPVLLGIAIGLVVGKTVGVTLFAWFAIKLGIGRMPRNTTWRHIVGLSMLAGIGFTVALFVASLAFAGGDNVQTLASAKIGIFAGSIIAGVGGYLFLRFGGDAAVDTEPDTEPDTKSDAEANAKLDAASANP
ncbi:MAG: NhaA family Na+:H+ antiporter [Nitriliruptoraceae bacterium]